MSVTETSLPETYNCFSKKWDGNLKGWTILSFQGSDSLLVVCLPELLENIPTVCFRFVVTGHGWLTPNTFNLTHAQYKMSRQLEKICELKDQTIQHEMAIGFPFPKDKLLAEKGTENFHLINAFARQKRLRYVKKEFQFVSNSA